MPRPKCCRNIGLKPEKDYFSPNGSNVSPDDEVELSLDEFEAFRLAHYEGLYQEQAAAMMKVSRPTFGRIIGSAHNKIADFLVNGKVLRISGKKRLPSDQTLTHAKAAQGRPHSMNGRCEQTMR